MSKYSKELRTKFTAVLTTTKQALGKKKSVTKNKQKNQLTQRSSSVKSLRSDSILLSAPSHRLQTEPAQLQIQFDEMLYQKKIKQYNIQPAKIQQNSFGQAKYIGSISHRGLYKKQNQDRVSIIPQIKLNQLWIGVYDGHAGSQCVQYIQKQIPKNYSKQEGQTLSCLKIAIKQAQNTFLRRAQEIKNSSGSCALILVIQSKIILDADLFVSIANVGDSRMITSINLGENCIQNTQDHKPSKFIERQRIIKNGGKVYESKSSSRSVYRILPGKLSVSRTLGDLQAKVPKYKGNPNILIATPDLFRMQIKQSMDFILVATDGLYDVMTNQEILSTIWKVDKKNKSPAQYISKCLELLLIQAFDRQSTDNISIVLILLQHSPKKISKLENENERPTRTLSLKDFRELSRNSYKRLQVLKQKTSKK